MGYNELLLESLIKETAEKESGNVFEWISEYLSYLPFGQYQWLEVNGENISNAFTFDWDRKDLVALSNLGFLEKVSEETPSEDKEVVRYRVVGGFMDIGCRLE